MTSKDEISKLFLTKVDFFLEVYQEKIPNNGEDACVLCATDHAVLTGVFDGCGGSGAKSYAKLQGKTGAYAASRIASAATGAWFFESGTNPTGADAQELKKRLHALLSQSLDIVHEASKLSSAMIKTFPTTAAIAVCTEEQGEMVSHCFWAGDSRVYWLDEDGLAQLSEDDLDITDAMENLYEDGVIKNVINLSKDFSIHHRTFRMEKPGMIFCATDGCFGYVSTPMEFEYMLVDTLCASGSPSEWERSLHDTFSKVAGDDYTLSGAVFGFGNFDCMQHRFANRRATLFHKYIGNIKELSRHEKTILWATQYKDAYYRYI